MKGGVKQYQFNTEKLEQIVKYISKLVQTGKLETKNNFPNSKNPET